MQQTFTNTKVQDVLEIKDRIVMETESVEKSMKMRNKKEEISKEVQKKKFNI